MRILLVTEWFPYPAINGAKIRTYSILRQLARFSEIDLVSQVRTLNADQVESGRKHLWAFCRSIQTVPAISYNYSVNKALGKLIDSVPPSVRYTDNPALNQLVAEMCTASSYDTLFVIVNGFPTAIVRFLVLHRFRPLIIDSLELGVLRPKGLWSLANLKKRYTWFFVRRFVRRVLRHIDRITVTSDAEYDLFRDLVHGESQCLVVPNCLHLADYGNSFGERSRFDLIYAGSFGYIANYEAISWFTREVFDRLSHRDRIRLRVTGDTADRDLELLERACPGIEFTGFVRDIQSYIARSRISIVPILSGGSTRLKILESMALGTPVVSTVIGAEGIQVTHGKNILLAETAQDFAHQVDRLIEDDSLWLQLSREGRKLVEEKYSCEAMGGILESLINDVI